MLLFYCISLVYLTLTVNGDEPKIIIIGAGPSGIATAAKLFENGFKDVTILEAENRIGGRVYTTRFADYWVDLGGQWVEGQVNNTVYEMASPFGLLDIPDIDLGFTIYSSKGTLLPSDLSANISDIFSDLEENLEATNEERHSSAGDIIRSTSINELKKNPAITEELREQVLGLFESVVLSSDSADSWHDVGVSEITESWKCEGYPGLNWKDKGYSQILDILMKKYPDPAQELPILNNTILNTEVVNVNYDQEENKALIKTADGRKYTADHVIVTTSLGVLKAEYQTLFTPALSESRVKHIKGLGYGNLGKIYFSFEEPWWSQDKPFFAFIWDEADRNEYKSNNDTRWLLDLFAFVAVEHKPNLLCGWLSGPGTRYMETLSEEQVFEQSFALLKKFMGKSYNNIPRPTGMLRTKWYSNKHFRGTYSFRSVESDRVGAMAEQLGEPIVVDNKPVIMFGGEATHPHYFGYVHGAIDAGNREARRLIDYYDIKL